MKLYFFGVQIASAGEIGFLYLGTNSISWGDLLFVPGYEWHQLGRLAILAYD